jgi:pyruvate/2-oxoglutarate dehydrogenase complex dihydrolipoamide dehydrogenase (E3) component
MRKYDLVIIGGGSAGLSAAEYGNKLGVRVALIEKNKIGGDCTWTGCIPSKTLIETAKLVHAIRGAGGHGIEIPEVKLSFPEILGRVNQVVEDIYDEESPEVLRQAGIDVYQGAARFLDHRTVSAGGETIRGKYFILATGAHAWIPPIPGLGEVDFLTYEHVWMLEELPERLVVLGGGAVGVEFAQAFQRLGSQVTLLDAGSRLVKDADARASSLLQEILESEGIQIHNQKLVDKIWREGDHLTVQAGDLQVTADQVLLSVGRRPNVKGLDLEKAGVEYTPRGITVDRKLKTSRSNIYAAGDCTGGPQFTHVASWQALTAVRNALLPGSSEPVIEHPPWTLFSDPEVAQVGLTTARARDKYGDSIQVKHWPMQNVDRAHTAGAKQGFVQVVYRKNGQVVGATVVGKRAGELIHEWVLAITHDLKVGDIASALHSYPSYAMANMQTASEIRTSKALSGFQGKALKLLAQS